MKKDEGPNHRFFSFLCCHPNGMGLKYIVIMLHISISIMWCTGIISNKNGNKIQYLNGPVRSFSDPANIDLFFGETSWVPSTLMLDNSINAIAST